jgi:methionyl-tRNA formyltransferase
MGKINVFIAGQKYFGAEVFSICHRLGLNVVGISCPVGGKKPDRLYERAMTFNIPVIPAGSLNADKMPDNVDLGIAAHSFDYVGRATRYKAKIGWIGYHPSLLPRHRGRDAVKWAIKMGDPITGGTVYWLNGGIDRGDIAAQDWTFIDTNSPTELWREKLCPIGLNLIEKVLKNILNGKIVKTPQDQKHATFEPQITQEPIFRPDLLGLPEPV